jgi:hypothetical protein
MGHQRNMVRHGTLNPLETKAYKVQRRIGYRPILSHPLQLVGFLALSPSALIKILKTGLLNGEINARGTDGRGTDPGRRC